MPAGPNPAAAGELRYLTVWGGCTAREMASKRGRAVAHLQPRRELAASTAPPTPRRALATSTAPPIPRRPRAAHARGAPPPLDLWHADRGLQVVQEYHWGAAQTDPWTETKSGLGEWEAAASVGSREEQREYRSLQATRRQRRRHQRWQDEPCRKNSQHATGLAPRASAVMRSDQGQDRLRGGLYHDRPCQSVDLQGHGQDV